jgi:hypothetical protein
MNGIVSFIRPCEGGGACVEVGRLELIGVRDSKNPDGHVLWYTVTEWAEFVRAVKAGEFDFA